MIASILSCDSVIEGTENNWEVGGVVDTLGVAAVRSLVSSCGLSWRH